MKNPEKMERPRDWPAPPLLGGVILDKHYRLKKTLLLVWWILVLIVGLIIPWFWGLIEMTKYFFG